MPIRRTSPLRRKAVVAVLACALFIALAPSAASAGGGGHGGGGGHQGRSCERRDNDTYKKLLDCVTVEGVREHQQALQEIADANGGTRAEMTPGYEASVDYVVETMRDAGWRVREVPFEYPGTDVTLTQLTPVQGTYESGGYTGAAEGTVEGTVIPVDINLEGDRASSSGCEAADFAGLDFSGPADIALVQRGTCFFALKAFNAQAAGAEAVIIFNQGNNPDREALFVGSVETLEDGTPAGITIPVVGASFADGAALAAPGSTASLTVTFVTRTSTNVIAELRGKNNNNVVMAGAHLDSVEAGPGINDNGSGSSALLEVAEALGRHKPQNTIRFAWWGAEEIGLLGSAGYVESLSQAEIDRIALYLNFDMVGSPNHIFMVYDADQSTFNADEAGVPIPEGSVAIEDLFESYYTKVGVPYDDTAFSGRSDYEAFILNDIPSSGLFTGAEEPKTEEQAAIWGGTAGAQLDPCYHAACDTFDNVNLEALDVNTDSIAFTVLTYAYSTRDVNGVRGKKVPGNFTIPAPAGPQGTFQGEGGGGLGPQSGHGVTD